MEPFERIPGNDLKGETRQRRAVHMVREFMKRSETYRRPHLERAKRSREMYDCWEVQTRSTIQRANIKLPIAYTIIQQEMPELFQAFCKERPFVSFQGRNPISRQYENVLTDFLDNQFDEMNFVTKFASFLNALLLDGTAIAKIPYKYKEALISQRVPKVDPLLGRLFTDKADKLKVLYDGPDFEHIPLHDFFPDWKVKVPGDIRSMRGCVHRVYKTMNELRQNAKRKGPDGEPIGKYINLDEVQFSLSKKGNEAWSAPYFDKDNYQWEWDRFHMNEFFIKDKDKVEIWEYWGLFDPNDDGEFEEYIITLANGDTVIRMEPTFLDYKVKPFVAGVNVILDNEFYGMSEVTAVRGLIKETQALRNARLDQVNLSVNRMWLVHRDAGIRTKQLYMRPNGIVWTNDLEGIRLLEAPELPASALREDQEISSDIQNATGQNQAPSASSSLNKNLARSATGAQMLSAFASSRVGVKIKLLSECFFKPMAQIMLQLDKQFVTDDKFVRMSDPDDIAANMGNPFTTLPVEAFYHDYDLLCETIADTGGADQQLQKYQMFAQMAQTVEATQPGRINWEPLMDKIGRDLVGRDIQSFIRSDKEMMQMQQQNLAMQAAVNAQQGQRAPQPNAGGQPQSAPQGAPHQSVPMQANAMPMGR